MNVTITGIKYQMTDCETLDQMTLAAERFVRTLPLGAEIILRRDTCNPADPLAVAAYYRYGQRVGYVTREEAALLTPLMNLRGEVDAVVCGSSNHVTFDVRVPDLPDRCQWRGEPQPRLLPPLPFADALALPFARVESGAEVVMPRFLECDLRAESIGHLLSMAEVLEPSFGLTICREDALWSRQAYNKLRQLVAQGPMLGISDSQLLWLDNMADRLDRRLSRCRQAGGEYTLWQEMRQRIAGEGRLVQRFVDNYARCVLECPIEQCPDQLLRTEAQRLDHWLDEVRTQLGCCPRREGERALARRLYVRRVSRREAYDVVSVLLLRERMAALIDRLPQPAPAVALPPLLDTPRGREVLRLAQAQGWLDRDFQPALPTKEHAALLGSRISQVLWGENKWGIMQPFWGQKLMAQAYQNGINNSNLQQFYAQIIDAIK